VYWSFCCISKYNRKLSGGQSGESLLICLGNFNKMSGCLVGRPTCATATTRLTSQLVGISTITYKPSPYIGTLFQCSFFSSIDYVC